MNIVVINASPDVYNLAADRITQYHKLRGDVVTQINGFGFFLPSVWTADKYYFSVIFTYDLQKMCHYVLTLKSRGSEIEIGGPAATAMPEFITERTGIMPHIGLDERFEHVPGDHYLSTFSSRGCPRACEFCLVSKLEGRKMIEYDDFPVPVGVNPYLQDNNLLLTSWAHQLLVVEKLKHVKNLDYNSGFDDRVFLTNPDKYWNLYSQLKLERWRFAYDKPEQHEPVKACTDFLHSKGVRYSAISVFCLIGFPGTTFEECRERLQYLIDIGTSPYPMRYRPLNSLIRDYTPPGWNEGDMGLLFGYYGNPYTWRSCQYSDYKTKYKKQEEALQLWD